MTDHLQHIASIYRHHTRPLSDDWNVCDITEDIAAYLADNGVDIYPSTDNDNLDTRGRTIRFPVPRHVSWESESRRIATYLPANYRVAGCYDRETIVVDGHDVAGWTLNDYVLPRLASGGIYPLPGAHTETQDDEEPRRYRVTGEWVESAHTDPRSAYTVQVACTIDTRTIGQTVDLNGAYRVVNANGAKRGETFYGPDAADSAVKLAAKLDAIVDGTR